MNSFEEKRQRKADRYRELSEKAEREARSASQQAAKMASVIPFGQPILVGHHSEKRDRNYRNRIQKKFEKSFELQDKAEYYAARARAVESNTAIFSDDPDKCEKLAEKIKRLEAQQDLMRAFNKAMRANDHEKMLDLGFTEAQISKLLQPDFLKRTGFPDYSLTNNASNIRRLKKRLAAEEAHSNDVTSEHMVNGVRIVDNVEENRVQLFFPHKPAQTIIDKCVHAGFHWSRFIGAWQRHRSFAASRLADEIAGSYSEQQTKTTEE